MSAAAMHTTHATHTAQAAHPTHTSRALRVTEKAATSTRCGSKPLPRPNPRRRPATPWCASPPPR
jgi:hypothetical protein